MSRTRALPDVVLLAMCALSWSSRGDAQARDAAKPPSSAPPQRVNLAERLAAGTLRAFNRTVATLQATRGALHVNERADNGVIWIREPR